MGAGEVGAMSPSQSRVQEPGFCMSCTFSRHSNDMSPNPLGLAPLEIRGERRSQNGLCAEKRFCHDSLRSAWSLSQCTRLLSEQASPYRCCASLFAIVSSSSCQVNISTGKFRSCCGWTKRKSSVSTPRPDLPGRAEGPRGQALSMWPQLQLPLQLELRSEERGPE